MTKLTTVLQDIDETLIESLIECDYSAAEITAVRRAEGKVVEVLSNETDYYWNIKLPCGTVIPGISGMYLRGMEDLVC